MKLWLPLLFLNVISQYTGSNDECPEPGPRIRKSWKVMTSDEKQLFKDAMADLMKSGIYHELQMFHASGAGFMVAHAQKPCLLLPWHRSFLLAFENALRAQDSKYRCVTVPIWEIFQDAERQNTGSCTNLNDCSPIITDMCGVVGNTEVKTQMTVVPDLHVVIRASGSFHDGYPCNQLCSHNLTLPKRSTCIPGALRTTDVKPFLPEGVDYNNTLRLFDETSFIDFAQQVKTQFHGPVHGLIGGEHGYLVSYASPNDPLFYIWHATIDYIYWLFHRCKSGQDLKPESSYGIGSCEADGDAPEGQFKLIDTLSEKTKSYFTQVATEYTKLHHHGDIPEPFRYDYQVSPPVEDKIFRLKLSDKAACPAYDQLHVQKETSFLDFLYQFGL